VASGGGAADGLEVVFPPAPAMTDQETITVRGTLRATGDLDALTVGGVAATTSDGWASWQAAVPLSLGSQQLAVDLVVAGVPIAGAALVSVTRQAMLFDNPAQIAMDRASDRVFSYHPGCECVVATDTGSGVRTTVSGPNVGSGPALSSVVDGLAYDPALDRVLTVSATDVIAIDVATGDRSALVLASAGSGGWPAVRRGLVWDAAANRVLVSGLFSVWAIDLTSGDRTIFSDDVTGTGPSLSNPYGMEIDPPNGRVLVASGFDLVSIDLATSNRTIISGQFVGSGPSTLVNWVTYDATADLHYSSSFVGELLSITPAGTRTLISDAMSAGSGPVMRFPVGLAFDDDTLYTADAALDAVGVIDPVTGARSIISGYAIGSGPTFLGGLGAHHDATGARVLGYDNGVPQLVAVGVHDGARAILSSATIGNGPPLVVALDMAVVGTTAFVLGIDDIRAIDLLTGDRSIVSSSTVGTGPLLQPAFQAALTSDLTGQLLWVLNDGRLLAVDVATGNRTALADDSTGTGPAISPCHDVVYDATRLLLVQFDAVLDLDPVTGNRVYLSGGGAGAGPALSFARFAAHDGHRLLVTSDFNKLVGAVDLLTGNRNQFDIGASPLRAVVGWASDGVGIGYAFDATHNALLAVDTATTQAVIISK
jgi:hypothetical protein